MISCLLLLHPHVTAVTEDLSWENLGASEYKLLEILINLLQPFAIYTTLVSGDIATISSVIPVLMELEIHLREVYV